SSSNFRSDTPDRALANRMRDPFLTLAVARFAAPAGLWLAAAAVAAAQDGTVIASEATLRDFMIQNVCLDAGGAVLAGVSPIDRDRRCASSRDLRPGERLPYHKHDHPNSGDRGATLGYQRHDSFPVETAGLGAVVEH